MRHPLCALFEGLDTCRLVDCQEVIPEGHALCWHCAAALADDFALDGPDDVSYRTPEPWGRPQTTWGCVHDPPTRRPKPEQE
jgi:hypothetical protein